MLKLDGRFKEGGGQILRSALALSVITGTPFTINHIRGNRKKPGLLRQHLTGVKAAAEISGGVVEGAYLGSNSLTFKPGGVKGGDYHFKIGSAGSALLVLQTVLPPLLTASKPSTVIIEGGTHNGMAPPYNFIEEVFLPLINRMGAAVSSEIGQYGFYPVGGGKITVKITPAPLKQLALEERGEIKSIVVNGIVANIPVKIARMEADYLGDQIGELVDDEIKISSRFQDVPSPGPGNAVMVSVISEEITELFTGFGARGVTWKQVADGVLRRVTQYLNSDLPVDQYLADQLLIPMAMGSGGSFTTGALSLHTETNIEIVKQFLDVEIEVVALKKGINRIVVKK